MPDHEVIAVGVELVDVETGDLGVQSGAEFTGENLVPKALRGLDRDRVAGDQAE